MENSNRGKLHRTVLIEWISILGAVVTCFWILFSEIRSLDSKIDRNSEVQSARSDRLYEMFIDLLKETKCPKS